MNERHNKNWNEEEKQFIRDNWKSMTDREMAEELNRGKEGVRAKRNRLGLKNVKQFTEEEKEYIRDHWQEMTDKEIGEGLNRPGCSVRKARSNIGLKKRSSDGGKKWTEEEKKFVKNHYEDMEYKEIAEKLDRNVRSIKYILGKLRLKKEEHNGKGEWSDEELQFLKDNYENMTDKEIGKKLDRGKKNVKWKRLNLGLRKMEKREVAKYDIPKKKVKELYLEKGYGTGEIANNFGVSTWVIRHRLKDWGVNIRGDQEKNTDHVTNKISKSIEKWWNESDKEKLMKKIHSSPNKLEKRIIRIIEDDNLPYKYVGSGDFILHGLNPDFVNCNGEKKIIEVFGRAFHDTNYSLKDKINWNKTKWGRKAIFSQLGYDTLILWDDELKEMSNDEVFEKIKTFNEGDNN